MFPVNKIRRLNITMRNTHVCIVGMFDVCTRVYYEIAHVCIMAFLKVRLSDSRTYAHA